MSTTIYSKQDSINWYLDRNFVLFPLIGKIPPKGLHWREVDYDPFFEAKENFGVQLQADDLVIDVDPRNGGTESFARLGIDEPTFTVETGSGGLHLYYKKPKDFKIRKNLKEFRGIDFISSGGYVVGAGSVHPTTNKPYFILKEGHINSASDRLLETLQKQDVILEKGTGKYVEDKQTIDRYREYLKNTDPAIEGSAGDQRTFVVSATGRDYGLSPETVLVCLLEDFNPRCQPPWSDQELRIKVSNAFAYSKGSVGSKAPTVQFEVWNEEKIEEHNKEINQFLQRRGGIIKANLNNTAILFNENFPVPTLHHLLGYNEFTNNIEFLRPAPWHKPQRPVKSWSDDEAVLCKYFMSNLWKFEPNTNLVHEAALKASKDHCFHPVRDYLKGLRWDGHNRAHKWLSDSMGAKDTIYTRAVGLKFLVAAVKRIFEPGCKFDYILTMEGKQGTYKSTAFEILAVHKQWYADPHMDIMNKDSVFLLFGKWIVEMPEMQTHYRAETTAMKGFLSRSTDRARMPYGRITGDFPRQCVFGGTINPEKDTDLGWLKDTTGNRRYWPVLVGEVHAPKLEDLRATIHQLWAEAYCLYKDEVPIHLEDMSVALEAENEQAKRLGSDSWQGPIEEWLEAPQNITQTVFAGENIYRDCIGGNLDKYGTREAGRISHVMDRLGWEKGVYWDKASKKPKRGYKRPELL